MLKKLKCDQCGSVDFIQQENDLYSCKFCGAKIKLQNPVKDKILKDLKSPKNLKHTIKFIKAKVKEEEFYKNALTNLSMNRQSPNDILESSFTGVDYTYKFFAVIKADFKAMKVENVVREQTANSIHFSSTSIINYNEDKNLTIKISDDMTDEELKLLSKDSDVWQDKSIAEELSNDEVNNISLPSSTQIEDVVNKAIENVKRNILENKVEDDSNTIVCDIESIVIYAIPKYSIDYTYKDKKYRIESFAHSLNLRGKIAIDKNNRKPQKNNAMHVFNLISIVLSVVGIIFSIMIMNLRLYKLNFSAAMTILVFALLFIINTIVEVVVLKNTRKKNFENKKSKLITFIKKSGYKLSNKDISYIDNFTR